ncbi:hypothetical protein F0562_026805 [Nyssa sinensis]|uniref:non-specific serine/threonine protein kinase n=1 Tax=Nyssa sinensis TaxID=561372 RepID=A0A5J5BAE1_9ASTE|nr:hypothetical protein F0562_026805 [Nyssa sinensis]
MVLIILVETADNKRFSGPVINVTKHLSFPDFSSNNGRISQDVKLLGSAIFSNEKGCVQIPDVSQQVDLRYLAGRAIYSSPIRLYDPLTQTPASFETTFSFQFNTTLAASNSNNQTTFGFERGNGGSGLTFIIVPDEFTVGRPGKWLGMLNDVCDDDYKAVGVEFDTRQNPEFRDPNDNHVGINLGSIVSTTTINASDVGVFLKDGSVHRAWVSYDGQRRYMDVRLGSDSNDYPTKPVFSGPLDLSPFLKEYMFVGFSASTGNFTQIHNVLSWNFTSTSQAFLRIPSNETCESKIIVQNDEHVESEEEESQTLSSFRRKSSDQGHRTSLVASQFQKSPPQLGVSFLNSEGLDRRRVAKEISAISRIRHPNLVPIRGWCYDNRETIVVYDYLPNGSLDKWLFGVGVLPWTRRFKVVKDIAEALSYLHSKQLAHKNVKTTSVFLDVSFRAVLGDFGFVLSSSESRRFESLVSQKADVFDFGIFVLEVVAGRRRSESAESDLLDLAWIMHETDFKEKGKVKVVDRRMGSVVNLEQAVRVLEIGLLCTLNENKGRPTMEEVVEYLSLERPVPELPPNRPIALFPYSSSTGLCVGYSCVPFK